MKAWIAKDNTDGRLSVFKHKPTANISLSPYPRPGHMVDVVHTASIDAFEEVLFSGWCLDKLFPELTLIKPGDCVQVEFNNDCFRILKEPKNES